MRKASFPIVDGDGVPDLLEKSEALHLTFARRELGQEKLLFRLLAGVLGKLVGHDATPSLRLFLKENLAVRQDVVEATRRRDDRWADAVAVAVGHGR